jgi:hypothetical protein
MPQQDRNKLPTHLIVNDREEEERSLTPPQSNIVNNPIKTNPWWLPARDTASQQPESSVDLEPPLLHSFSKVCPFGCLLM